MIIAYIFYLYEALSYSINGKFHADISQYIFYSSLVNVNGYFTSTAGDSFWFAGVWIVV